jgi:hypothetical protein
MKPEILLKAYVLYESEEAFRELVAGSVNEVYSTALRIIPGTPHLVEETVMRVYCELARKAPRLGEEVVLSSWLREQTCKMAGGPSGGASLWRMFLTDQQRYPSTLGGHEIPDEYACGKPLEARLAEMRARPLPFGGNSRTL